MDLNQCTDMIRLSFAKCESAWKSAARVAVINYLSSWRCSYTSLISCSSCNYRYFKLHFICRIFQNMICFGACYTSAFVETRHIFVSLIIPLRGHHNEWMSTTLRTSEFLLCLATCKNIMASWYRQTIICLHYIWTRAPFICCYKSKTAWDAPPVYT